MSRELVDLLERGACAQEQDKPVLVKGPVRDLARLNAAIERAYEAQHAQRQDRELARIDAAIKRAQEQGRRRIRENLDALIVRARQRQR